MKPKAREMVGYPLVIWHFIDARAGERKGDGGELYGAKTNLAKCLGVSRQIVHRWEKTGIPLKYLPKLRAETGLTNAQIRPDLFA